MKRYGQYKSSRSTGYSKVRRYQGKYKKKSDNVKKMMGHVVNKGLEYAKSYGGPIGTLARTVGMMKTFINSETKFFDISGVGNISSSVASGWITTCNLIPAGDQYNQRSGISIINKNLTVNMLLSRVTSDSAVKVVLLCDKKPDEGQPIWSNVYLGTTFSSQIDKLNVGDRFVILKEKDCMLTSTESKQYIKWNVNLTGTHTKYDQEGNGTSYTELEGNAFVVLAYTDNNVNPPTYDFFSRFRYHDN